MDYQYEDRQTDDLIDAWRVRLAGMTPDEIEHAAEHRCGECGTLLTLVRPGKWQCDRCEDAKPIQPDISGAAA